jgi:hypothetical protein
MFALVLMFVPTMAFGQNFAQLAATWQAKGQQLQQQANTLQATAQTWRGKANWYNQTHQWGLRNQAQGYANQAQNNANRLQSQAAGAFSQANAYRQAAANQQPPANQPPVNQPPVNQPPQGNIGTAVIAQPDQSLRHVTMHIDNQLDTDISFTMNGTAYTVEANSGWDGWNDVSDSDYTFTVSFEDFNGRTWTYSIPDGQINAFQKTSDDDVNLFHNEW